MRRLVVPFALALLVVVVPALAADPQLVGPEFVVNAFTTGDQVVANADINATGDFVVTWTSYGQDDPATSAGGVFGQRFGADGMAAGSEFPVNTFTTGNQGGSAVSMGDGGDFVIVWASDGPDGDYFGIQGRRYDNAGAPIGGEFQVNSFTTGRQSAASVSRSAAGDFVVVWDSGGGQDGDGYGVFGQRYDNMGNPVGMEFMVNSTTADDQQFPDVAIESDGNFVVVWESNNQDGAYFGVFGQRYDASGMPVGSEFQVNSETAGDQRFPKVGAADNDKFVVVWDSENQDGSYVGVFGQRFDGASTTGPEFQINSYTTGNQLFPAVDMNASGEFVVVWDSDQQDGSYLGVFGRHYDANGTPGAEFQVNAYTDYFQDCASPGINDSGDFVVAWTSYGQDAPAETDRGGIFAQRYTTAEVPANDLVADLGADGAWLYSNNAAWNSVNSNNPEGMAVGDIDGNGITDMLFDFGGGGTWIRLNNMTWQSVTLPAGSTNVTMDVGNLDGNATEDIVFNLGAGFGIQVMYDGTPPFVVIDASANPPQILASADLDGNGMDDPVFDLEPGIGILWNNASSLTTLSGSLNPEQMISANINGNASEDLVFDFGTTAPVYQFLDGTTWNAWLFNLDPGLLAAGELNGTGADEVVLYFPSNGLTYIFENNVWRLLLDNTVVPALFAIADLNNNGLGDLVVHLEGAGEISYVYFDGATWQLLLQNIAAEEFLSGNLDGNTKSNLNLKNIEVLTPELVRDRQLRDPRFPDGPELNLGR